MLVVVVGEGLAWQLTLLHVNDIHVRMEETNKYSAACRVEDKERGRCFGGLARLYTAVNQFRGNKNSTVWLNAGDFFQGTVWYSHFKWKVVAKFNRLLEFDAMSFGNHEFDDGVEGLVPFLQERTCPMVAANLDISAHPELRGLFSPSLVLLVGGRRVGVVGYLTPETLEVSNPGKILINDEITAVREEVAKLTEDGVDIIIALGHSGYDKDIEIAEAVPDIDIIVGGHTHSFLYTSQEPHPSGETVRGPYPTLVNNRTLVVQAFAYTKFLGHLKATFSEKGELESWTGEPILLDKSFKEDEMILEELKPWKVILENIGKDIIGSADSVLFRSREGESNIGNLVTDAMVWAHRENDIHLAMVNSGGIRASFDRGRITMGDLLNSFPFRNTFDIVVLRGDTVRRMLEHSVANMREDGRNDAGRFLQVSGFRVTFDLSRPEMKRLVLAEVACPDCPMQWKPLHDEDLYSVVMTNYLAGGGDGFSIIPAEKIRQLQGPLDTDILKEYIRLRSPLRDQVEGRIVLKMGGSQDTTPTLASDRFAASSDGLACCCCCSYQLWPVILLLVHLTF